MRIYLVTKKSKPVVDFDAGETLALNAGRKATSKIGMHFVAAFATTSNFNPTIEEWPVFTVIQWDGKHYVFDHYIKGGDGIQYMEVDVLYIPHDLIAKKEED